MPDYIEGHERAKVGREMPVRHVTEDGGKRVTVSSWVDLETAELLDRIAEAKGITKSTLVREAVQSLALKQSRTAPEGVRVPRRGTPRSITALKRGRSPTAA